MRTTFWKVAVLSTLPLFDACAAPEVLKSGEFDGAMGFRLGNWVRVQVNGEHVKYQWRGFNKSHGHAYKLPWEEIQLDVDGRTYAITDKECSNQEVIVEGQRLRLPSSAHVLLVTSASGVSIVEDASVREFWTLGTAGE